MASASCETEGPRQRKVDPVFPVARCSGQGKEHRAALPGAGRCAVEGIEHRVDPKLGSTFGIDALTAIHESRTTGKTYNGGQSGGGSCHISALGAIRRSR